MGRRKTRNSIEMENGNLCQLPLPNGMESQKPLASELTNGTKCAVKDTIRESNPLRNTVDILREDISGKLDEPTGASMAILLTQGVLADDQDKLDTVLKETKPEIIQATLNDFPVAHVIPLLNAIEFRLRNRRTNEIRPWIRWLHMILSIHMPYLSSQKSLHHEMYSLLEWMTSRIEHQQKIFALHGKLSVVAKQIELRSNRCLPIRTQPLIIFNNEDLGDSDMEDLETMGSDNSGRSGEDDWWDDDGLGRENEDNSDEENGQGLSDDGSDNLLGLGGNGRCQGVEYEGADEVSDEEDEDNDEMDTA